MKNYERWINDRFLRQFPQFLEVKDRLTMNGFCDIMMRENDGKCRIIAVSNCSHSVAKMDPYEEPFKWTLKE